MAGGADTRKAMLQILAVLLTIALPGQAPARVTSVTAAPSGGDTVVTIVLGADARVSQPRLLEQPWRIYFDIPGVAPGDTRLVDVGGTTVARVRLALNQPQPAVTRVVIELTRKAAWRMERADGGREVRIVVEGTAGTGTAGTGADANGAAAGTRGTVIYAPPPAPSAAVDRREQIRAQLFAMGPTLDAMRAWTGPSDGELAALMAAIEQMATGARAMKVTGSDSDLAMIAAVDAIAAAASARARALADGSPQSRANAVAAASGALLLIDHLKGKL